MRETGRTPTPAGLAVNGAEVQAGDLGDRRGLSNPLLRMHFEDDREPSGRTMDHHIAPSGSSFFRARRVPKLFC